MSFIENPKIDLSSERCEESVNKTRSLFTRKEGFILREENPDCGVDFDVELIENREATRRKFAIQIKSSKEFKEKIIGEKSYLSLDFYTSRLGYLSRNTPGLGLVVIYDESRNLLFYEYIEEIIERINETKGNSDWLVQEKVRIFIPINNVLDRGKIENIYKKFQQTFKNYELLLQIHAKDFNVPLVKESYYNEIKIENVITTLENIGLYLINDLKFSELYNAINKIPYHQICQNPKLSFLAAIVYSKIGKPIDSNMFLQYVELQKSVNGEDYEDIIAFTKFTNDFTLGKRDINKFISELSLIENRSKSQINKFTFRINISLLKLMSVIGDKEIDETLLHESKEILHDIEKAQLDIDTKHFLIIFQLENYHTCALKIFSQIVVQQKLKETLGVEISYKEKLLKAQFLSDLLSFPIRYLKNALLYAEQNKNDLLRAHVLQKSANFMFSVLFDVEICKVDLSETTDSSNLIMFENSFNNSIQSYNIFINHNQYNDAHISLVIAYEVKQLGLKKFDKKIGQIESNELLEEIRKLESEIGKSPFCSVVEKYFNDEVEKRITRLTDLSEEEIDYIAKSMLKAKNLPIQRLENIKKDIKSRQLFEKYCDKDKYELHQDNVIGNDIYVNPTNYIVINKKINLVLGKGNDVGKILRDLGLIEQ